ncbi:MAG: TIGR02147 family protein, partial [Proteobacteria bacterium]
MSLGDNPYQWPVRNRSRYIIYCLCRNAGSCNFPPMPAYPLNIFEFRDPIAYLNAAWADRQARNPKFSLRAWSRKIKVAQATALSEILRGLRPIPAHYIPRLSESLNHESHEKDFFSALIAFHQAELGPEKLHWQARLNELEWSARAELEWLSDFKFFQDPITILLLECTSLQGFEPTPAWINSRLPFPLSSQAIERVFRELKQHQIIKQNEAGQWIRRLPFFSSVHDQVIEAGRNFHESSQRSVESCWSYKPTA